MNLVVQLSVFLLSNSIAFSRWLASKRLSERQRIALGIICFLTWALMLPAFGEGISTNTTKPFSFALMGDVPYSEDEEERTSLMLQRINRQPLAFIVHIGDIKSGYSLCSDELLQNRFELF